jgi:hypothetical protein
MFSGVVIGNQPVVKTVTNGPNGPTPLTAEVDGLGPSYSYVLGPGCYAWQIDSASFSETIVVEAKP